MLKHDPDCPFCAGRGHVFMTPEAAGWMPMSVPRHWLVPNGGGVREFLPHEPELVMKLCACVREVTA